MAKNCADATSCSCGCHHCRYGSHCGAHNKGCHIGCSFPDPVPLREQKLKDPVRRITRKDKGKKK